MLRRWREYGEYCRANPDARVIGIDKSALRVDKHEHYSAQQDNYRVIVPMNDFWRLVKQSNWNVTSTFCCIPTYPKDAGSALAR